MSGKSATMKKIEEGEGKEKVKIKNQEMGKYEELKRAVDRFVNVKIDDNDIRNYNKIASGMHELCACILDIDDIDNEENKYEIREVIKPVLEIQGRSPLYKRLREWPRGYMGDFETIEYLLCGETKACYKTFEYYIENYTLRTGPVLQHKYKIIEQSQLILEFCLNAVKSKKEIKILSIGCGSNPDLQIIQDFIVNCPVSFDLIDYDEQALEFSKKRLDKISGMCNFRQGNIMKIIHSLTFNKYDLIVSSGLFDYIPEKLYIFLLKNLYNKCLKDNGLFFLTNIANDNPFKIMMKYFINWELIERSEKEISHLINQADINLEKVNIYSDPTRITYLIKIFKD